jgi:hypothetical protein
LPVLAGSHLDAALSRVKARTATEIGAPQVPNVAWSDVGGLEDVKQAILDTIELPLKHRCVCGSWRVRLYFTLLIKLQPEYTSTCLDAHPTAVCLQRRRHTGRDWFGLLPCH